jgi:hypothetical protein
MIVPTPNMSVVEWADMMTLELERYGSIGRLDDPERWKDWANRAISVPNIAVSVPPIPDAFDDWRSWAERFIEIARLEV